MTRETINDLVCSDAAVSANDQLLRWRPVKVYGGIPEPSRLFDVNAAHFADVAHVCAGGADRSPRRVTLATIARLCETAAMTQVYQDILAHVVATARAAGALTQSHFALFREIEIGIKGPADFVSEADRQSELLIRQHLFDRYPDWGLTGEEFAPVDGADPEFRWLVDPIDGTTNFVNGMHYTISIALRRGNQTVLGALYNPVADEMFTAIQGHGAFLNGTRLHVNPQPDPKLFAIGTGLPTSNLHSFDGFYERLQAIRDPVGCVRITGSSANSCAYVACGRLTGYFEESGLVDWAVGVLLVQEAGGIVTDWWGRGPEYYEASGMVIVANPANHAWLLARLRDAPRKDQAAKAAASPAGSSVVI